MTITELIAAEAVATSTRETAILAAEQAFSAALIAAEAQRATAKQAAEDAALSARTKAYAAYDAARLAEVEAAAKKANRNAGLGPNGKPLPEPATGK
jgi:redox-regulated HSP33 family molecular chaperone